MQKPDQKKADELLAEFRELTKRFRSPHGKFEAFRKRYENKETRALQAALNYLLVLRDEFPEYYRVPEWILSATLELVEDRVGHPPKTAKGGKTADENKELAARERNLLRFLSVEDAAANMEKRNISKATKLANVRLAQLGDHISQSHLKELYYEVRKELAGDLRP